MAEEWLERVLGRGLGAGSDRLWPPHPSKSLKVEHLIRLLKDAADPVGRRIFFERERI